MSTFEKKHATLIEERVALQQEIHRESLVIASVTARIATLSPGSDDYARAVDKRRHSAERLSEKECDLIAILGKIDQLRFEAAVD